MRNSDLGTVDGRLGAARWSMLPVVPMPRPCLDRHAAHHAFQRGSRFWTRLRWTLETGGLPNCVSLQDPGA